jgi:hypothetical protein
MGFTNERRRSARDGGVLLAAASACRDAPKPRAKRQTLWHRLQACAGSTVRRLPRARVQSRWFQFSIY